MKAPGVVLVLVLMGCGSGSRTATDSDSRQRRETEKHPLSYYEATLRPTDFDEEVEVVRRAHEEEKRQEELLIPKDSLVLKEEQVLGFRIQIFSSSSIDDASAARSQAQVMFPTDTVYVVYDPPVYKVRVGDYPTRLEANQQLGVVQEKGYGDAWVVPDRVVRRKWVGAEEK